MMLERLENQGNPNVDRVNKIVAVTEKHSIPPVQKQPEYAEKFVAPRQLPYLSKDLQQPVKPRSTMTTINSDMASSKSNFQASYEKSQAEIKQKQQLAKKTYCRAAEQLKKQTQRLVEEMTTRNQ